jgi:hypothetical protein
VSENFVVHRLPFFCSLHCPAWNKVCTSVLSMLSGAGIELASIQPDDERRVGGVELSRAAQRFGNIARCLAAKLTH